MFVWYYLFLNEYGFVVCVLGCIVIGRGVGFMLKFVGVDSWVFLMFVILKCIFMDVWLGFIFLVFLIFMFLYFSDVVNIDLLLNRGVNLY